jgi:endonuclease I
VTADTWEAENGTGSATGFFIWTPQTTGTWNVVFSATDKDGTTNRTVAITVVPEGPGTLAFDSDGVHVRESAGAVTLTVERTGGAAGAVTVAWATVDGTAAAGSEYVAGGGALAFADGQTRASFQVALLDDTAAEDNKSFSVTLGNVTGGAEAGDITTCTVTIIDDDDANADYYASCYKNGVLKTGDELKNALCQIINTGVKTNGYDSGLNTFLNVIDACPTNSSLVQCIYLQRGISRSSYNKEHIWAQSHGIDEKYPGYSDLHHIRASDSTMNNKRGNLDFDNCQGKSGAVEYNGCYYISNKAWEPPDSAKGDVARAMLYMDVRYENKYNSKYDLELVDTIPTTTTGNQLGKLSTLLAWNELDPVDAFETNRNELIYTKYQGNRNPFIDHPDWARAVFDPDNYLPAVVVWTVSGTVEGSGWVNGAEGAFSAEVTNGTAKTFFVQPNAASHYHIGSISWNGALVPQAYYTNAAYYNYTTPAVTNHSTLAVAFAPDLAALGTPIPWLAQYGTNAASVAQEDWDAAELEDWNDDGVPNWQEYQNGTDPTALSLRQVTGVAVSNATADGFTVSWNAVGYADGYRVRICETAVTQVASAGFEGGGVDSGWSVSESGAAVTTEGTGLDGAYWLKFSADGAWLCSPEVEKPALVEFSYRRSSNTDPWTLAVEVRESGSTEWTPVETVADAGISAKTASIDLSAWNGSTVRVRLLDARGSGTASRYVDAVKVYGSGGTAAEGTSATTSWSAVGLSAGTAYDVFVRAEATTLGEAAGPWSAAVRAATLAEEDTRQEQSITFPAIADQTVGATVELTASAGSGLAVEYAVAGPARISGTTLTCAGPGTVTVTASQPGNEQWKPAEDVTRTFVVTEPELSAPSAVWASATNATDFTAAWSAVDGATGYELSVWTQTAGGSVVVTNETVLFSSAFEDISGNGNARLNADAIAGWTFTNAFAATNEIKVGVSGAGGSVTSATYAASGTLRVVTEAHAWGSDGTVLWVGATGQDAQSNQLDAASGRFTNTFEGVDGEVAVSWSTTAGKKRFLLEAVEISVLTEGEGEGGGETVPVDGYDARPVEGTSCTVAGLAAETTYFFRVRATAGAITGPWSDAAEVTTLAEEPGPAPEPEPGTPEAYEAWLAAKVGPETAVGLPCDTATTDDFDGDGISNWDEYVCDTDPADSNDMFRVTTAILDPASAGEWTLELRAIGASASRGYQKLVWTNLLSAPAEGDIEPGDSGGMSYEIPVREGCVFGGVRVLLEAGE